MVSNYRISSYENIKSTVVSWLWYPYIPYGKITLVQGDPGEGKTTLMLQIAADITASRKVPGGKTIKEPQNVIFQTSEDGLADTVKPRLERAGADSSRVFYLESTDSKELS